MRYASFCDEIIFHIKVSIFLFVESVTKTVDKIILHKNNKIAIIVINNFHYTKIIIIDATRQFLFSSSTGFSIKHLTFFCVKYEIYINRIFPNRGNTLIHSHKKSLRCSFLNKHFPYDISNLQLCVSVICEREQMCNVIRNYRQVYEIL